MALRIVVEGAGTIETAVSWQSVARVNASGGFSFSMPAADPAAAWLTALARVSCYWDSTLVGAGVVEDMELSGDFLNVAGGDLAHELLYKAVRYANSTYAETIANELGALLPAGWSYVDAISGATNIVSLNVMWDSLQSAVNTLCELAGLWWHVVGTTLTIANGYGALVAGIVPLSVTRRMDASNQVGIIFPFGAGDGMAALSAQPANVTLTAPYVLYQQTMNFMTAYGVARTDAPGYPATARRKRMDFKQVAPPANTDAGIIAAANTLINAAVQELRTNGTPIVEYDVEAAWPGLVRPLDRVALVFNDGVLKVSETLVATEVTTNVTPESLATVRMRLEAGARRILSDNEVIADAVIASRISPAYPQLGVYDDTITDIVRVDYQTTNITPVITEGAMTYTWPPFTTQVFIITAARSIAAITEADGSTNAVAGVPTALEYRLNGAGAWAAMPPTLDLTAALVNATTLHQLAPSFTLNVRGVLRPNLVAAPGTALASIPALPVGTRVRIIYRSTFNTGTMGTIYSTVLYGAIGGDPPVEVTEFPLYSWVTIRGNPTLYTTASGYNYYFYPVTYRSQEGYVFLYVLNASNNVTLLGLQYNPFATVDFTGDVVISLQTRLVSQAN